MKRVTMVILLLAMTAALAMAASEARFMTEPAIHGDKIVFCYEGDLWLMGIAGGPAARLTTFPGTESSPQFSPDGQWLAFSASYDGGQAVYLMPAAGGEPQRLTYNPLGAQVVGWTPDGERIIFRSRFENTIGFDPNLYFLKRGGSAPERFPLDRGVRCSFSPDGRKILYSRKGNENYYWKRYKGGQYQDIWMYDFDAKTFTPITDYVGKNSFPMWVDDRMYFISDRANGIANIFVQKLAGKEVRPVTHHEDFDVMWPSSDGRNIVYIQNGVVRLLDLQTEQSREIHVVIPSDRWAMRPRTINPCEFIHTIDIANDGKTAVIEARGDVFTQVCAKETASNLSSTPGSREMFPAISPNGRQVAFFSDRSGDYQLYVQDIGGGPWTQLTSGLDRIVYRLAWSPDGQKILFGNKDFAIFYVELASRKLVRIDGSNQMKNDEFYWEIADYAWSPDSQWIAYSFVQSNRNSQIFIFSLAQNKRFVVTDDFYDNINPCFDADGRFLFFLSSRNFNVQMDFYEDNHVIATPQQVMGVQLRAGERPPFSEVGEEAEAEKKPLPMRIDIAGIGQRIYPLPVSAGNYFYLRAGRGRVIWCSLDKFSETEYEEIFKPGGETKWNLHIFNIADKKETVLDDKVRDFRLSVNGEQLIIRRERDVYATSVEKAFQSKNCGDKLNLDGLTYLVDVSQEWPQIFNDVWRWYRDFFYDAGFHGHDWRALGEKFRSALRQISSRGQLNWLLSQMVGELCVSHTYIYGGDLGPVNPPVSPVYTGLLGADLIADANSGLYRLAKIYGPTDIDRNLRGPLVRPDVRVKEGDFLLAINGSELKAGDDYFKLLQVTAGKKVRITVSDTPSRQQARSYDIEPLKDDADLRFNRWLADNIKKVDQATNGRVGYMYISAMDSAGIGEFDKFWRAFRYRDGVIIDVRGNGGGWTEYFMIDKLERQLTSYNVLRGMAPFRYPGAAGNGNYVLVINEDTSSDGEAFVDHFQVRKLGPVVGVPTWGGLVGILNRQTTIDNGGVEQSNNAFYGRDGKWIVENHGADPDILVDNDPASVTAGHDPQLEKAIEVILEKIKANPPTFPTRPEYPKK